MSELPPDARDLLARARAEQPRTNVALRARVRVAVERAIALSVVPAAEHGQPELGPTSKVAQHSLGKLATAAALATVVAVMAVVGFSRGVSSTPAALPRTPAPQPSLAATASVVTPRELAAPSEPQLPASSPSAHEQGSSNGSSADRTPVHQESLASELRVVRRADSALRAGHPRAALRMLEAYQAGFEVGQLASERDDLSLMAECMLGRPRARARAQIYLQGRASSLVRGRIAAACELPAEPPSSLREAGGNP